MTWHIVQAAFKGLSIGVIILLVNAVLKLKKAIPNSFISVILFAITLIGMLCLNIFQITIPSVSLLFILFGLIVGLVMTLISRKEKGK